MLPSADSTRPPRAIKLLLIEDSPEDAELTLRELARAGLDVQHHRVDTARDLEAALDNTWDLVISDFSMPAFDGMEAFQMVRRIQPDVPVIFVSGVMSSERAVRAMRAGARDFVVKEELNRLAPAVERELDEADVRRGRARAEHALEQERHRFRSVYDSAAVGILEMDLTPIAPSLLNADVTNAEALTSLIETAIDEARIVAANDALLAMFAAREPGEIVGPVARSMRPGSLEAWRELLVDLAMHRGKTIQKEVSIETLDGREIDVLLACIAPETVADFRSLIICMFDVSERKSLERQMRAAQRMEAVGQLAGGIAHDFNNILTVIGSYVSLLLDTISDASARKDILVIQDAANRAAGLTRQLLAFSRRQVAEPKLVDLNEVVSEMEPMLRRIIGEDVDLVISLDANLSCVEIDPSHLEQILMNLTVNARDAMPEGGKLTIETALTTVGDSYQEDKPASVPPGDYVMVAVTDDGVGMDAATQERIFEPFFTTKEAGHGTGLGLSTVYGIVKQAGGFVWAYSELETGTTFKIYLPPGATAPCAQPAPRPEPRPPVNGRETVLLVEDEEQVRRGATRILERAGYEVLTARNGIEALEVAESNADRLHAVISDVIMPEMSGAELAKQLETVCPGVGILFMSGYPSNAISRHGVLKEGVVFIQKPFTMTGLLDKLREVLNAA